MQPGATLIFLDANVICSRTFRDWFCLISEESGVEGIAVRWSEDVLAEYVHSRRRANPGASDGDIGGWRHLLTTSFPDATIRGYTIDPRLLHGKDAMDAHVLAAAHHGNVDYLVTSNLSDFEEFSEQFEFEIFLPDEMLCLIKERRPDAVQSATKRQLKYWASRPESKSLPQALVDAGAPKFAEYIQSRLTTWALSGSY